MHDTHIPHFYKTVSAKTKIASRIANAFDEKQTNYSITQSGPGKPRGQGDHAPLTPFLCSKKKEGNKEKN